MKNQFIGFTVLAIMFALSLGWFQRLEHQVITSTPSQKNQPADIANESTELVLEQRDQFPPSQVNGSFAAVNMQRIQKLAGESYKGPSYMVKAQDVEHMVAEQKQQATRIPASSNSENVKAKKGNKRTAKETQQ